MAHTSTPSIAIVILNWNGIKDTITCLDSLESQSVGHSVIVIDNGSIDKSVDTLTNRKDITLLVQSKNLGFAGGVNVGIKYAIEAGFEYVALFNNDATADNTWLENLIKVAEKNHDTGIVTGLLLNESGTKIDSTGEQYSIWGMPFPGNRGKNPEASGKGKMVFGATGGASLYRTKMLQDIGLFDENFFAYYEDVDISFRAQLAGWKVAYEPKAIAYHKQGATSKKIPGFTVYQTFKNLPLLFIKNVPLKLLFPIGIRLLVLYWMMFANAIIKGKGWYALKGWVASIWYFWISSLWQRFKIQSNKKVTTAYIKSMIWHDLPPDQTGMRKLRKLFTGKD